MTKKKFPKNSVCKPCWELKYCPYGSMVEWFPTPPKNADIEEIKQLYEESLERFSSGSLETEEDILSEIDTLLYLLPDNYEYLMQFETKDIACEIFGHACPVFLAQSGATETKVSRQQGRYLPREVMLKVVRRDGQMCQTCHKHVRDDEVEFDHIIPYSRGGPTTVDNIRLLCRACNRKKSNSLDELLKIRNR